MWATVTRGKQLACGVVYVNKVMEERQDDKGEREKRRERNVKSPQVHKATREDCLEERG